ncbi:1-phosphofructokinase family hexose kinase [Microbacterium pygmaeum]|uniref:Tagatose 6-phosphate kinase n=1 Tax=Microbacterium pygmaeum TaxID=370764 RepID=A0A1G7TY56_9MICO|nr:hexose kinase [Microbacterium pygmaeum]SDG39974.1 tagatose 6-phosphate kinase [Microbacterium pygmaeum]
MLTITLNAALDVTYEVAALQRGESHVVQKATAQAGGKGINVARVVCSLGRTATITGLIAGTTGAAIRDDLRRCGLSEDLVDVGGESRRTMNVVDAHTSTIFNERGDALVVGWDVAQERMLRLARSHRVVVASGSVPAGVPVDVYARIVRAVHDAGGVVIVDATGDALLEAARGGADILKPNAQELLAATGRSNIDDGIADLIDLGAGGIAASLGADGIRFQSRDRVLHARPHSDVHGNPTGAGDAAVAALAIGLEEQWPLYESVRHAVALSAAAVAHPLAGHVDHDLYSRSLPAVTIEELTA